MSGQSADQKMFSYGSPTALRAVSPGPHLHAAGAPEAQLDGAARLERERLCSEPLGRDAARVDQHEPAAAAKHRCGRREEVRVERAQVPHLDALPERRVGDDEGDAARRELRYPLDPRESRPL